MVGIRSMINFPSDDIPLQARLMVCPMEAGHYFRAGGLQAQIRAVTGGREEAGT